MKTLVRLVYCSRMAGPASAEELQSIQPIASRNNWRDEITGALIVYNQRFIQVLEGARADVSSCFARIAKDARHSELTMLSFGRTLVRDFDDWTMRMLPLTPMIEERLSAFFEELDEGVHPDAADRAIGILKGAMLRSAPVGDG